MIKVIYTAVDQAVAQRISADLQQAGYEVGTEHLVHGDIAIFVFSQAALADSAVQATLIHALDLSLHIIPVALERVALPALIDHLEAVDFSAGDNFAVLHKQIDIELSPDAPLPMRVLTPTVRRSNRTAGVMIAVVALIMFVVGLIAVGIYHIQAPIDEFNNVDTMAAMTIAIVAKPALDLYAQFLPQNTEEAQNYLPTLLAVPTVYRPLVAQTATAVARKSLPATEGDSDFGF